MSENPSRTRSPRGRSPSGRMSRWPCKDYLRGTCNNSFCEKWHHPECLYYKTKSGCRSGEKCSFAHRQVDAQPTKCSKSNNDKSAVAILKEGDWHGRGPVTDRSHDRSGQPDKRSDKKLGQKSSKRRSSNARQLDCVFQDMTPPKSILWKSTDMRKPIQRVKYLHVPVSCDITLTSSRSDLMSLAVFYRHATREACFGFILSFSMLHFHHEHHVRHVQKKDHQAPIIVEVKEFGEIGTHS